MQFGEAGRPPQGVVYDSSFGETIDTVLALALLHGFEGKRQARIACLASSKSNLKSAQLCDVIEKFYASATTGLAAIFLQGMPIGLAVDQQMSGDTPLINETLNRKDAAGKPAYTPRISTLNDTAIAEIVIRNALMAQHDQNAIVVMAGPATNLARLLDLPGARDLIAAKVKMLAIAGGELPDGGADPNFAIASAAAKRVLADWPTPVVACGREVGGALLYPAASIESDYGYNPDHPVAAAYRAAKSMPYDAPSTAMAAMLYALRPDDGYFRLSDPGTLSVSDDGRMQFQASSDGRHRHLIADPAQKDRVVKTYTEMASAKPVPRALRRPSQNAVPPKPEEKKKS